MDNTPYQHSSGNYADDQSIFPEQDEVIYAGFWQRLGAAILDGLILMIPNLVLTYGIDGGDGFGVGNFINIVVTWLYYALMESSASQATLGKRALGLRVVNQEGGRISFGQATGRHFAKLLSTLILCIGYLMMLWDSKKQTLHDKLAGTYVVQ